MEQLNDSSEEKTNISEYSSSEYTLTEITPEDINNLPANVIKYYNPNTTDKNVHYFEINFKNSVYGEGANSKYFKWSKDGDNVKLVETTNSAEAVLVLKYNDGEEIQGAFVDFNEQLSSVNKEFVAQNIKGIIDAKGEIGSVSSKFVGNTIDITSDDGFAYSAILSEYDASIHNVNSSFIGNTVNVNADKTVYGTLIKSLSRMDNINSEFIGNTINAQTEVSGGILQISSAGKVKDLSSDFLLNSTISQGANVNGAIIQNEGTIDKISSNFAGNYGAASSSGNIRGGVLYNSGSVGINNSAFSANYAKTESGDALGGAIHNKRGLIIENSTFFENYAESSTGKARGGAIYSDMDVTITANNGKTTEFTGNYVKNNGVIENQAIYMDSDSATLKLTATDNGEIIINDNIDGVLGYKVNIGGDSTGFVKLFGDINNANITVSDTNLDLMDNIYHEYNFTNLSSKDTAQYHIDVNFADRKADTFTLGSGSSGVVYISEFNQIGQTPIESTIVQVLNAPDTIRIELAQGLIDKYHSVTMSELETQTDAIAQTTLWDKEYFKHYYREVTTNGIRTAVSDTARNNADSIEYYVEKKTENYKNESLGDTLGVMSSIKTGYRSFNAQSDEDIYVVKNDIGNVADGTLNITGIRYNDNYSKIDADGHNLFEFTEGSGNLNISTIDIINTSDADGSVINNRNAGSTVTLSNVSIDSASKNAIINDGILNIQDRFTTNSGITGTGTLNFSRNTDERFTNGASIVQDTINIDIGGNHSLTLDKGSTISGNINLKNGHLYISADDLLSDAVLSGSGRVKLQEGTLNSAISSTTKTHWVDILGDVTLQNTISSGYITILGGKTLTTNADYIKSTVQHTSPEGLRATLNLTGGTLSDGIINSSAIDVNILGEVNIAEGSKINGMLHINENGILNSYSTVANAIGDSNSKYNDGIINIYGEQGEVRGNIYGSGTINIFGTANLYNEVNQDLIHVMEGGKLELFPTHLKAPIWNDSVLQLHGNNNNLTQRVYGDGYTEITARFISIGAPIEQEIKVLENASVYINNVDYIGDTISNEGLTVIRKGASTTGELRHDITGSGTIMFDNGAIYNYANLTGSVIRSNVSGPLYSNANLLHGDIVLDNGTVFLMGGTLNSPVYNYSTTAIHGSLNIGTSDTPADVVLNKPVSSWLQVQNNSSATIEIENVQHDFRLYRDSNLFLKGDGVLDYTAYGSTGTLNILGNISTTDKRIEPNVHIAESGTFTADSDRLSAQITNNGKLYLSGTLNKAILGDGTTYINDNLTLGSSGSAQTPLFANLDLNNGTLKTSGENPRSIYLGTAKNTGTLDLKVNIGTASIDNFVLNSDSDAIFKIGNLEIQNFANNKRDGYIYQVLKGGSSAQLSLDWHDFTLDDYESTTDTISSANVNFDDEFNIRHRSGTTAGTVELAEKETPNDSIRMTYEETQWNDWETERADILAALNRYTTTEDRNFNFKTSQDKYTVLENLGNTAYGVLNINGRTDEDGNRSTIDMNGYTGLITTGASTTWKQYVNVNIENTEIVNSKDYAVQITNYNSMGTIAEDGTVSGGIINSAFRNNTINNSSSVESRGGAVYTINSVMSQIKDSVFSGNQTFKTNTDIYTNPSGLGAALNIHLNSAIGSKEHNTGGITNSIFENNSITLSGNNVANGYGAAIYMGNNTFISNIKDSTIQNNTITGGVGASGGGIYLYSSTKINNIENTKFLNNTITGKTGTTSGGAIHLHTPAEINTIKDSYFFGNSSRNENLTSYGGGIGSVGSNNNSLIIINSITGTTFENNFASYGSAIYFDGKIGTIDNCKFLNNTSDIEGAARINYMDSGVISNTLFQNNKTSFNYANPRMSYYLKGNTFSIAQDKTLTLDNVTFDHNIIESVTEQGNFITSKGAALLKDGYGNMTINNSKFINNYITGNNITMGAGAVSLGNSPSARLYGTNIITNSLFKNNIVEATGSAQSISAGALLINSSNDVNRTSKVEITGTDFINNQIINHHAISTSGGGALNVGNSYDYDEGLELSNATFDSNSVTATRSETGSGTTVAGGGAILTGWSALINIENSVFKNNSVTGFSNSSNAGVFTKGGAIYSLGGKLTISNSTFENNSVTSTTNAHGGAIYAKTIDNIINCTFKNNYVSGTSNIRGGAIATDSNLKITATDGFVSEISGNYIINGDDESTKVNEGIYVNAPFSGHQSLTLNAEKGGQLLIKDRINGYNYDIILTGDETGKISLHNDIKRSATGNLIANNVSVDLAEGVTRSYDFSTMTSEDSAKWTLDIDFANKTADNFKVGKGSSGIMFIDNLNVLNTSDDVVTIQILNVTNPDDNIQLALDSTKINVQQNLLLTLGDTNYNDVVYHQNAGYGVGTTKTLNDSIIQFVDKDYDGLNIISASNLNSDRYFIFRNSDKHTVSEDFAITAEGSLHIQGIQGGGIISEIDADNHSLFNLSNDTKLYLSDVKLTGTEDLIYVNSPKADVNLSNVIIDGNINGPKAFNINISGENSTINGTVQNARTTLNSGSLTFNEDTFAKNDSLILANGNVNLSNGKIEDYRIYTLNTNDNVDFSLDFDLANRSIDRIHTITSTSNGIINISNINYISDIDENSQSFVVKVLDTNRNNNLSLALDENLNYYTVKELSRNEVDEVAMNTDFSHVYYNRTRHGELYGELYITTLSTTNDSIGFKISEKWETSTSPTTSLGDTLKLVNQADLSVRNFNSSQATDVYTLKDSLGQTANGTLSINGTSEGDEKSTVDLNNFDGFQIGADTVFNVNNTKLTGTQDVITITDSSAQLNLNNAYIDGNIVGNKNYKLNIAGLGNTTINGLVSNADVLATRGELTFGENTFADTSTSLTLDSVSVNMRNGELGNYNIANLTSTANAKYYLDINLETQQADTITTNGSGVIVLDGFNILGTLDDVNIDTKLKIQILNTNSDNLQLQLSESILSQLDKEYVLSTTRTERGTTEIKNITNWKDTYQRIEQDLSVVGRLSLDKTKTDNDSIALNQLQVKEGQLYYIPDDTLKLFSQADINEDRRFLFDSANDIYNLGDNLGTTSAGNISIEGVKDNTGKISTINMNSHNGFGLSNDTTLNISNTKFENINNRDGSVINISNADAIVNLNNVIIGETESANAIVNAGTINMTGGNILLNSGIKGGGITNITGSEVVLNAGTSITQKQINVQSGSLTLSNDSIINGILSISSEGSATITTGALTSALANDGELNIFTDGTLAYNISGEGKTNINGNIINNAKISQDVDVISGSLTTSAENVTGNINNNAVVTLNGTLSSVVTGLGTTYVKDTLTLAAGAGIAGTLNLNNGSVSTNDSKISNYNIGKMTGNGSFSLDIDVLTKTSDKFTVGAGSNGTVFIDSINLKNADSFDNTFKVQILDSADSSIKLALNDEIGKVDYKIGETSRQEQDSVNSVTNYKTTYLTYNRKGDIYGNLALGQTKTENDSILINTKETRWAQDRTTTGTLGDTLVLWNTLDSDTNKEFVIDKVDTYTVSSVDSVTGLGATKGKNVTVSGVSESAASKSAINFNNKTGFELTNDTTLNINNTKLTNAKDDVVIAVTNKDAVVNLNNAYIDGNINGFDNTKINISGDNITTLDGKVSNSTVEVANSGLKFNTNTFESSDTLLIVNGGNVNLDNDGKIEKYIINELLSNQDTKYSIDIDLQNQLSDTINVKSGSGIITIDNLNIKGSPENVNKDYKIQILDVESGDLQLALSTKAQEQLGHEEYLIGTHVETIEDTIKQATNVNDVYERYTQTTYTYGTLSLVSTKTENDSIGIKISKTVTEDKVLDGIMGDTLKLVNNSAEHASKSFEFNSADEVYTTKDNLGKTAGALEIKGVSSNGQYSTIEMNKFSGFELDENSELNISNIQIRNAEAENGAIIYADTSESKISLENVNIVDNTARSEHGGAIYSKSDVTLTANAGNSLIKGNKTAVDDEAVYLGQDATLTLNAIQKGEISIDDKINGEENYSVKITGDETGKINLNNKISNANIDMENVTLRLSTDNSFETSNFTINSGTLDLVNGIAQQQLAQSFHVTGSFNLNADVDLAKEIMDRLPENTTIAPEAYINVDKLNLISDTQKASVEIPFANEQFKDQVKYIGSEKLSKDTQITAYSPIYKYDVKYENRDDLGYFVFSHAISGGGNSSGGNAGSFNPAVLSTPVTAQSGTYNVINQTLNYAFEHADTFTLLPEFDRMAILSGNKYAILSDGTMAYNDTKNREIWFHPFATFESIPLKNGPKVNTTTYGSLAGGNSELRQLHNGWSTVTTVFTGYSGSSQNYAGVSTYQNGGLLGATQTWYKGNFYTALTATAGANVGESHTMYGSEDFTSLLGAIASKSGYNFDFADGKFTVQPSMLMSYSFIKTFDYKNAAGVNIESSPVHVIQIHPNVRFIANTKNGWQPYASVGMVWNVLDDSKVMANDVRLPGLSVKPFVEYGLGIQKRWGESFTAQGQAMVRSGGRNGIALTAGFKWTLGKKHKPTVEQVKNTNIIKTSEDRTILKQLSNLPDSQSSKTSNQATFKKL